MLAIARSLAPELARGLSTSLALLANRQACPDCICSPSVQCAHLPKPADCICEGNQRQCPATEGCPDQLACWAIAFLAGVIIGVAICAYGAFHCGLFPKPAAEPPSVSSSTTPAVEDLSVASNSPAAIALQRLKENRRK